MPINCADARCWCTAPKCSPSNVWSAVIFPVLPGRNTKPAARVCGIELPKGLKESDKLPEPIFTPATKATTGHDENIPFSEMCRIVGEELSRQLRDATLKIYTKAADYARTRGIIIADTKFEFGMTGKGITLADEVLTPDSSRFWPADKYQPGKAQESYDKQYRSRLP